MFIRRKHSLDRPEQCVGAYGRDPFPLHEAGRVLTRLAAAVAVLGLLTLAPGPDLVVVVRRAVVAGARDALRTVGGIVTGLLVWGALTAAGLAAVLAASPTANLAVRLLGAQALWPAC